MSLTFDLMTVRSHNAVLIWATLLPSLKNVWP